MSNERGSVKLALSRLRPLHINKGKTVAQTISARTDYAVNPDKTRKGELVSGYECDPRTADTEFLLSKKEYAAITGRNQGKHDVLAYNMLQSFKPGEVDAETANKIGYELALRFTGGRHAFIVATHTDRSHVHNHIVFNSTDLNCTRKFKNFWGSSFALRKLNDIICLEYGLSIIENPKPSKGNYGTWLESKGEKEPSKREKLERFIEEILLRQPTDFDEFLKMLKDNGCEVKHRNRTHISLKIPGQKSFIRLRSLSDDYTEEAIRERISGNREAPTKSIILLTQTGKVSLLIDIQNSIKAKNSPGYERWAKTFNLKQAARTLIFLQENGLDDMEKLKETAQTAKDKFNDIQSRISTADTRLKEISTLQKHISTYIKTRTVFTEYRKAGYSKKFLAKHEAEITAHKAAKTFFNEQKLDKLPTIKMLKQEYATVSADKKKAYSEYHKAREYMQEILTAKQNAESLLNYRDAEQAHENDRRDVKGER